MARSHQLLTLLAALATIGALSRCTGASDPAPSPLAWQGPKLTPASGSTSLVLDRLPATYALPESNLSVERAAGSFLITQLTALAPGKLYSAALPFRVPKNQRRFAPPGMRVFVGETELAFTASPPGANAERPGYWTFERDELRFAFDGEASEVRVEHPSVVQGFRRLNFDTARADGLTAEQFVHHGITLGPKGREGLLLPAPASATWSALTLPKGASFRAEVSIAPTPILSTSDGAAVVVEVVHEGQRTEAGRQPVPSGAESFLPMEVDLTAWAGKTVDLIVRTEAVGTVDDDYVFLGSPEVRGEAAGPVRRVIVIGIDTLRPDHLSINGYHRATSPELDAWAQDAVRFDRAWTSAPRTRPSFRSATTGRLPLEAVCAKNIGEVFDEAGFATAGIVSNVHLNQQFDFQRGFDLWWLDGAAKVDDQTTRARQFIDEHQDRDLYLFLHVMDPHIFYRAPEPWYSRFTTDLAPLSKEEQLPKIFNRWQVYRWDRQGKLSDLRKQWMEALYDGEVAYTSHTLGAFLSYVDSLPGENLIVIHNDHGEEFWEHGGFEHNHTLYDDTTRGLLWIKPPGGTGHPAMTSPYPATLQDIAPTLYDFAGLADTPPTDGVSLIPALRGEVDPREWARAIPIGHLQYDVDQWGVVWNDHKYSLVTGTGKEELYDLRNDPAEQNNLAGTVDTEPYWRQLALSHKIDAGPGWRLDVDLPSGAELVLTLPADALVADVLDPELHTRQRANQEWGEVPKVLPSDVGQLTLADDKRTIRFVAGPKGKGKLYVRFAEPTAFAGLGATLRGTEATIDARGKLTWKNASVEVSPGVVLVSPESEVSRMKQCGNGTSTDAELEELRALGYIHDER
jgi:arylsulfatase A-like enzyme